MFTPRKQASGDGESPGTYYGFLKSGLNKVTGRFRPSTSPEGAQTPASPASPVAATPDADQQSPELDHFVSPTQDLATSQQGTPDDAVNHGEHASAVGLFQHGSVLAGANALQPGQSVKAHGNHSGAQELAVDMPACYSQALVQHFDPESWPTQSAKIAERFSLSGKRTAGGADDAVDAYMALRHAKRQRLGAQEFSQTSDRQLAVISTRGSSPTLFPQPPAPGPATAATPFRNALALPLPSPQPAAPTALPSRRQGPPRPSRFSQQAPQSAAFAAAAPAPTARPPPASGAFARSFVLSTLPFPMGSSRPATPRYQHHKPTRSGSATRSGKSVPTAAARSRPDAPTYPKFRLGGTAHSQPMAPGGHSPMPKSIFPSGPAAFGSPLPALPSSRQAAPSQQAQQALVPQSQQQRLVSQHDQSMQRSPGLVPGQSTAGPSDTPTTASADDASGSAPGSRQSPRHGSVAASWTPMKASNDLPRQALENKLMRGKQLPPNSLIAAGLDPTRSASTPRPHSIRRFKGMTPKRKADELQAAGAEQHEAAEEQGRHKQARTASPEPAASQQPKTHSFAPPPTALLGFAPPSPTAAVPLPQSAGPLTTNAEEAFGQADATGTSSKAQDKQVKDYGAPWVAAAAQNGEATSSPASPAVIADKPTEVASPPFTDTLPKQSMQGSQFAPSPSTMAPNPRSSLTDSLASPRPSFSSFASAPLAAAPSSTPAASPAAFPSFGNGASFSSPAPTASTPAPWTITNGQTPASPWGSSPQQQQQQAGSTPSMLFNAPAVANGPSKQADGKGKQAASTSSDGSGDTTEELYPFPSHRSPQDRLEGIVSSPPYAEDSNNEYVFGRSQRTPADQNVLSCSIQTMPSPGLSNHANGISTASQQTPARVMQDGRLSPGEAKRLHTISSAVPLPSPGPESDSEDDMHMPMHDKSIVNGRGMTPDSGGAASDGDHLQTTASEDGNRNSSDGGSDVSEISGMGNSDSGSIAATEVLDDEPDATVVIGAQASPTPGWGDAFLQRNQAAAQDVAEAADAQAAAAGKHAHAHAREQNQQPAQQEAPAAHAEVGSEAAAPAQQVPESSHAPDQADADPAKQAGAIAAEQGDAGKPVETGVPDMTALPASTGTGMGAAAPLPASLPLAQPTWPANNPPNARLMWAVDVPLPEDPPEPAANPALPSGDLPPALATQPAEEAVPDVGQKPRRKVKLRRNKQ